MDRFRLVGDNASWMLAFNGSNAYFYIAVDVSC